MSRFYVFMGYKYLFSKKSDHSISSMIIVSWISIMVSSSILILISGIMNGFEYETIASLKGLHATATIQADQDQLNVSSLTAFLKTHVQEVEFWAPQTTRYGCIYKNNSSIKPVIGSIVFIDPLREPLVRSLQKYLIQSKSLEDVLSKNTVIIGHSLAQYMNVSSEDEVRLLIASSDRQDEEMLSYEKEKVSVGGILKTGIDDIDMHTVFCSYDLYKKIYGELVTEQLHISFNKSVDIVKAIEKIKSLTELTVYAWQEHYPALLDALKLEKRVALLITFLIVLMAMMSIIALLFMFVESKKADISLLIVLGASVINVRVIFMIIGFFLVSSAALFGFLLALLSGYAINNFALFPLPDAYFISHVTVLFDPLTVFFWYVGILVISFFAMLVPLYAISDTTMQDTVRFER